VSNGHKGWPVIIALGLIAATLLVYSQAGRFDFINFDDDAYVYANAPVRAGLTRAGVLWAFFTIDYFYWQPLTWLSHMLDCELFGLNAGRHHLTSVLFHVMNSLLVFFVFRRMTGAVWRSAMLAALFALHPLRVESVAWIAERKDVLSGFWFLAMLWAYARYTERPSNGRYGLVLGAMLMGLMAKPMLVTAPFLLLLLDYWPLRRVAIAEKAPMLMMAAVSVVLTALGTRQVRAVHAVGIPAGLRLECRCVLRAVYRQDAVAAGSGHLISVPRVDSGLGSVGRGAAAGGGHRGGVLAGPLAPLPSGGVAVVRGGTAAHHRVDAGGAAGPGRPVYIHSADGIFRGRSVGGGGARGPASARVSGRRGNRAGGVRHGVVEPGAHLARQRHGVRARAGGHAG